MVTSLQAELDMWVLSQRHELFNLCFSTGLTVLSGEAGRVSQHLQFSQWLAWPSRRVALRPAAPSLSGLGWSQVGPVMEGALALLFCNERACTG